jgi:hypothetical protein
MPPAPALPDPLPCLVARSEGALLHLAVVPGARRTEADGLHDGALKVRIAAAPVEGKANEVLLAWLAAALGLPRRALRLARGASARRKAVEIDAPPHVVSAWLGRVLATPPAPAAKDGKDAKDAKDAKDGKDGKGAMSTKSAKGAKGAKGAR